jgi:hypothetical protein
MIILYCSPIYIYIYIYITINYYKTFNKITLHCVHVFPSRQITIRTYCSVLTMHDIYIYTHTHTHTHIRHIMHSISHFINDVPYILSRVYNDKIIAPLNVFCILFLDIIICLFVGSWP